MNNPEKATMSVVEEYLKDKNYNQVSDNSMIMVQQLSIYQNIADSINKELETKRLDQVRRVYREFKTNEYGKRFNCTLADVVSAIMGEDNVYATISLLKRENKQSRSNRENIRTYNLLDGDKSKYSSKKSK